MNRYPSQIFQHVDAQRFYKVAKRLQKFGLTLHEGKSSVIRSGWRAAKETDTKGKFNLHYILIERAM